MAMRLGAFFLGGIVGAAATIYLSNKNKNLMMSAFSSKNDSFGEFVDQTVDKAKKSFIEFIPEAKSASSSTNKSASAQNASSNTNANATASASSSNASSSSSAKKSNNKSNEADLDKVEDIVSKDPKLKAEVDEILVKNGEKQTSYQLQ
jgi:hypothetical protein